MIDKMYLRLLGRDEPYRCLYLGGTFDCLHRGHITLFENARKVALKVVVSLNTDEFASRYKRPPLMSLDDRVAVLVHCNLVDIVLINIGNEDSKPAILLSGADAIGHGTDWTGSALMAQMQLSISWLNGHGISMAYLPYTHHVSTTQILERHRALTDRQGPG